MIVAYLIRHAEPVPPHLHAGPDTTRPLSDRGRRQAVWLGARLAGSGAAIVLTSPYLRCRETAEIIAEVLDLSARDDASLHMARAFTLQARHKVAIYVAHSNNIPVALAGLHVDCHACGHASCWTVRLDDNGRVSSSNYEPNGAP